MSNHVPDWVHMAEVPPPAEEEAWRRDPDHVTPVGGWIVVALLVLVVLVAIGWAVSQ